MSRKMERNRGDVDNLPHAPTPPRPRVSAGQIFVAEFKNKLDSSNISKQRMRQKAMQFELVGGIEQRNIDLIQQLIDEGVDIDAEIIFTFTPLTHAIQLQHEDIAIHLLKNGCDPIHAVDEFPYSLPIHLAAREDMPRVVEELAEKNADTNAVDKDGMTALHIACYNGKINTIKTLVRCGANIDCRDSCNRTPIHRAIEGGWIDVVKELLACNVDINATDIKNWTPLHLAIALDYKDIVMMLLEAKCRLDILDVNGRSPLTVASDYLNRSNVDIIRTTQFNYHGRRADFLQGRYLNLLQRLPEQREMLDVVVTLINVGCNIDGPGLRPITVAAKADNADTVYMLINAGAWIPQNWEVLTNDFQCGYKMAQLVVWIELQYNAQISLLHQCRRQIRVMLAATSFNLEKAISKLPLPLPMINLLK